MDQVTALPTCNLCHVQVRPRDYFCYNCGANLHPRPLSTSIGKQIMLYIGSVILMPFGVIWGYKYLRQQDPKAKIIGSVIILISIVAMIYITLYSINFINTVQEEIHRQLQNVGY